MNMKQIQQLLDYLGYSPGAVDGIMGKNTRAAIQAFQTAEGLTVDGIAGDQTQIRLKDAVWQDRFAKDNTVPSSGQPPDKTGTFWDGIQYFTRTECRCKCGGKYCDGYPAEMSETTMLIADEVRRRAGVPLRNDSALRCQRWNAEQGGVANSNHMTGHAIDLAPIDGNISVDELYRITEEVQAEMIPGRGGLGKYSWGIHEDDGKYSRWNG